jgi:hypothetical protein
MIDTSELCLVNGKSESLRYDRSKWCAANEATKMG